MHLAKNKTSYELMSTYVLCYTQHTLKRHYNCITYSHHVYNYCDIYTDYMRMLNYYYIYPNGYCVSIMYNPDAHIFVPRWLEILELS